MKIGERDTVYVIPGNSGYRACQHRLRRVDVLDGDIPQAVLRVIVHAFAIAQANKERGARALHPDSADMHPVDPATVNHFQRHAGNHALAKRSRLVRDRGVCENDVLESTLG